MKLYEIAGPADLQDYVNYLFEDETINEGVLSSLKDAFSTVAAGITKAWTESNKKGRYNDVILGDLYKQELNAVKTSAAALPENVRQKLAQILKRWDINISAGVDLSRNNFKRYCICKLVRLCLFIASQLKNNGVMWLLGLITNTTILSLIQLIFDGKDAKSVFGGVKQTMSQIKILSKEVENRPNN